MAKTTSVIQRARRMEDELEDIDDTSVPNEEPTNPQSLVSTLVMSILAFLFSIGCCYFALFSLSFRHGLVSSAARHAAMESECLKPIPARFLCPNRFPNRHHNESHAKWTGAVLFTLETQYRRQGIADKRLQPNQYILLSGDSFAGMAATHHSTTIDNLTAHIGRRIHSSLPIGAPENLRAYVPAKDPCRSIHPIAETDFKKPSPIEFEIISLTRYSGVEHIKRSLSAVGRPFPVSFRMPNRRFWFSDPVNQQFPSLEGPDKSCITRSFPPPTAVLFHDQAEGNFELGEYVTMAIVGFNDNFVIRGRNGSFSKGGFILRAGFAPNEHSAEYFASTIVPAQESQICPDDWPANSTRLCVDANSCELGARYVFVGNKTFRNLRTGNETKFCGPFEYAAAAFPVADRVRNYEICGYVFMPYSSVEEIMAAVPGSFAFDAVDIQVTFGDESYDKDKQILASTRTFKALEVQNPYDNITDLWLQIMAEVDP